MLLPDDKSSSMVLPVGVYEYPFSVQLPPVLPASQESGMGNVRYSVEATIDRPWKFNHNVKEAFTIPAGLDLNLEPPNLRVSA